MKFSKWISPKTNETRVYVNGATEYGTSVFVVDGATTGHFSAGFPEVIVRTKDGRRLGQSEVDDIMNRVDAFVQDARPSNVAPTFTDYLALAG